MEHEHQRICPYWILFVRVCTSPLQTVRGVDEFMSRFGCQQSTRVRAHPMNGSVIGLYRCLGLHCERKRSVAKHDRG